MSHGIIAEVAANSHSIIWDHSTIVSFPSYSHAHILSYSHILKSYLLKDTHAHRNEEQQVATIQPIRERRALETGWYWKKIRSLEKFTWPGKNYNPWKKWAGSRSSRRSSCSRRNLWTSRHQKFSEPTAPKILWRITKHVLRIEGLDFFPGSSFFFPQVSGDETLIFFPGVVIFLPGPTLPVTLHLPLFCLEVRDNPFFFCKSTFGIWVNSTV